MENQKRQSTFLVVVGIATLLVAIVGATFAYFSITVAGNDTASSIRITTQYVGSVTFLDGTDINVTKIYPGWSATKNFVIENKEEEANGEISYAIVLDVTTNTISPFAAGSFVYTLSGTSDGGGTTINVDETPVPTADETMNGGILIGKDTHSYTFSITLEETGSDQNAAQGRDFAGVLQVELAGETGKRTWVASSLLAFSGRSRSSSWSRVAGDSRS